MCILSSPCLLLKIIFLSSLSVSDLKLHFCFVLFYCHCPGPWHLIPFSLSKARNHISKLPLTVPKMRGNEFGWVPEWLPLSEVQILSECELCAVCCVCLYTCLLTFRHWTVFPVVDNSGSVTPRERSCYCIWIVRKFGYVHT